jgi:hypothetical protein
MGSMPPFECEAANPCSWPESSFVTPLAFGQNPSNAESSVGSDLPNAGTPSLSFEDKLPPIKLDGAMLCQ